MSLSTRCPACSTTFKVVPDQLKISEGWVRCGRCGEVFDASSHLQPLAEAPAAAPAAPLAVSAAVSMSEDDPSDRWLAASIREDAAAEPSVDPEDQVDPTPVPAPQPAAVWVRRSPAARMVLDGEMPEPSPVAEDEAPLRDDPLDRRRDDDGDIPSALLLQTADNDEPQQSLYQPAFVPPAPVAGTLEANAEAGDSAATLRDLDFVRVAERRAFWQRPLVVFACLLVCTALGSALLLQFVRAERDRLAAHLPGLRPALESLCVPLQCRVMPLQRIESIVIDASSFNKAAGELYQFDVEVRNTADVALATPSLELTLTDTQDQPLVRRVLTPAELKAPAAIAASGAWSGSLPVRLQAPVTADRVAGYRVLAFYP